MRPNTRKLKRIRLVSYLDVYEGDEDRRVGQLLDITVEGLGIRAIVPYTQNRIYQLRVMLPTELQGVDAFTVDARCAWVGDAGVPGITLVGFQFVDISPATVEVIEELISRFQR